MLQHADGDVRNWQQLHEATKLPRVMSTAAGGVNVLGMISWHTMGPLIPVQHCLNATASENSIYLWPQFPHLMMATST